MKLSPLTRRRAKELARLSRKRVRDDSDEYLIEGVRAVESAIAAGAEIVEIAVTTAGMDDPRLRASIAGVDVPVWLIDARELRQIADTTTPQGVIAVGRRRWTELADLEGPIVALDGVQDPGNVGAIIRSSAWFSAAGLLVGPQTADPFGPKAVRAAMGGLWNLNLTQADDLALALVDLRRRGYDLVGADLDGQPLSRWKPAERCVVVMGNEAHGLSPAVKGLLDETVTIGQRPGPGVESLNVAVAAGIVIHHWLAE